MTERSFAESERKRLASAGEALPDGSYPMPDCDAVHRAVTAYGRETPERRPALRNLIARRKIELGCDFALPESWHLREGGAP